MKYVLIASAAAAAAAIFASSAGAQSSASLSLVHASPAREKSSVKVQAASDPAEIQELADAAERAVANSEFEKASGLFTAIIDSDHFSTLEYDRRHYVLSSAAEVASLRTDFVSAHALYKRTTAHQLAGSDDWMGRLNASWFIDDLDDAVDSLDMVARNWPDELRFVSEWAMNSLLAHARSYQADTELLVLQKLFETSWQTDLGVEPTQLWLRLIEILAEHDDLKPALAVSSRLRDPLAVVTMLSDKRFEPVIESAPDWFSVEEAMDAGIIEARLAVDAHSDLLAPAIELSEALLRAGRHKEALMVIETHLARSALKSVIGDKLEDAVSEAVRALTTKALALIALERYDEAATELALAAQQVLPVDRLDDFLNVAQLQACLGLPDAALATLDHLSARPQDARTYFIRFMAARAYQDHDAEDAALRALIEHSAAAPAEVQHALLLSGNIDAAADLLIRRLNDPLQRQAALLELQGMRDQAWPIKELDWRTQSELLTSRTDVRESVATAGGTVSEYEIYRWN